MCWTRYYFVATILVAGAAARSQPCTKATDMQDTVFWPLPQSVQSGTSTTALAEAEQFKIVAVYPPTEPPSDILEAATSRFHDMIFNKIGQSVQVPCVASASELQRLQVMVADTSENLQLHVDETYELEISGTVATINASTVWGALYGLETFAQAVQLYTDGSLQIVGTPLKIRDGPRFPWRGMLIDTSRHYYPVSFIKHIIEALSYNRLNTLHWHVVDAESFPVQIEAYPRLAGEGAYTPRAVYSAEDISSIVAWGLNHGVRVVLEVDVPGHSYAWGMGYPDIVAQCPSYEHNINNIPLSPASTAMWKTLEAVLGSLSSLTADNMLHIGGDEVVTGCWLEDPAVQSWMKEQQLVTGNDVLAFFEKKALGIVAANNKTAVVWQELFEAGIDLPDTIVEVWKDSLTLKSVVSTGTQAILAAGWYLAQQIPNQNLTFGEWEDTWKDFYLNEPTAGLSEREAQFVLGGEAAMWSEQVDSSNFDSRVWPRACAVAERLWSDVDVANTTEALARLDSQRCRMLRRGVAAGPVRPGSPCL